MHTYRSKNFSAKKFNCVYERIEKTAFHYNPSIKVYNRLNRFFQKKQKKSFLQKISA